MSTETPIQPPTSEIPEPVSDLESALALTTVPPRKAPLVSRLLINRNFSFLALGQAISNVGDNLYSTTLLIWVFILTHSAAALSGVLVAQYVPIFVLGPVAGVFVDR